MKINIKQILLPIFVLIATAIMGVFIYDLLSNLDSDILVSSNNNLILNNQISARDVKNITTTLTSNNANSTIQFMNGADGSPAGWIIAASMGAVAVLALGSIGILACCKLIENKISNKLK